MDFKKEAAKDVSRVQDHNRAVFADAKIFHCYELK
jgi:hypothetical protein